MISDAEKIEICCELVNTEFEKTRDGRTGPLAFRDNEKLAKLIGDLCAGPLSGYIDAPTLTQAFKDWRRRQSVAETFGSGEDDAGLENAIAETAPEGASVVSLVLGMLFSYMGEEAILKRKVRTVGTMRRLKEGETARGVKGPGSLAGTDWITCATIIEKDGGVVAVLPEAHLSCVWKNQARLSRKVVTMSGFDVKRLNAKWAAIIALFKSGKLAIEVAKAFDVSRQLLSHHQRNFAEKRLATDPSARVGGVKLVGKLCPPDLQSQKRTG